MRDWFRHTIDIARSNPDLRLLVKPHPAELDEKVGYYVSEVFTDLAGPFPDNVVVLPYQTDLPGAVAGSRLTVMWAGTSVIELALMRQAFLCASALAREEYDVDQAHVESRDHYERLILGEEMIVPDGRARRSAIDLVHRITTTPVREEMRAFERQLTNGQVRQPQIDLEQALQELESDEASRLAAVLLNR
jgi:hypothetical protein